MTIYSDKDITISGCTTEYANTEFDAYLSNWKISKREHDFDIITDVSGRNKIWKSVTPGAYQETGDVAGYLMHFDLTINSGNTLKITYNSDATDVSTLDTMRFGAGAGWRDSPSHIYIVIKDYTEEMINPTTFLISFNGYEPFTPSGNI